MTNIFQAFLIKQLVTYFICQKNIHPIFFISFFIGKIYTFASNLNTFVNFLFICIFLNLKKICFFIFFYLHFLKFRITFYFCRLLQQTRFILTQKNAPHLVVKYSSIRLEILLVSYFSQTVKMQIFFVLNSKYNQYGIGIVKTKYDAVAVKDDGDPKAVKQLILRKKVVKLYILNHYMGRVELLSALVIYLSPYIYYCFGEGVAAL